MQTKHYLFKLTAALVLFSLPGVADAGDKYPLGADLGGAKSPYASLMIKLALGWPQGVPTTYSHSKEVADAPVRLRCYSTPGNRFYIGVQQGMTIRAPLSRVTAVLDDFATYTGIFDGLKKSEVRQTDGNKLVVFSEYDIPLPFIPNERTEMFYLTTREPSRVVYRYQLKKSNHLKVNDGLIVVEPIDAQNTRYTEFDFWDADWGIAKTLAPGRIWSDSVSGLFQSDLAIQLKSENPSWPDSEILKKSKAAADKMSFDSVIRSAQPFPALP